MICNCWRRLATTGAEVPSLLRGRALHTGHWAAEQLAVAAAPRAARRPSLLQPSLLQLQLESVDSLVRGIIQGDRLSISRSITLAESSRGDHQLLAAALLRQLRAARPSGTASRDAGLCVGVSGPPGAGKSTLIETLGCALLERGERVAVLAVDPSSQASGGSILGDKTRMPRLSASPAAYVRPTPARGTLGGIARATTDAITICQAASYSTVLVETVGVGQSETAVHDLVDCLLLVLPPVGGDELQVIKRGITEFTDLIAINKEDVAPAAAARAVAGFRSSIHWQRPQRRSWAPAVLTCSAHTGAGIDRLVGQLSSYHQALVSSGELFDLRRMQRQRVAWTAAEEAVLEGLRSNAHVRQLKSIVMGAVGTGELQPREAGDLLALCYWQHTGDP